MKVLFIALTLAVLAAAGPAPAQNEELWSQGEVSLRKIGVRIYSSASGETVMEPLYTVRIGDTTRAEAEAAYLGRFFSEYSLNAVLYVRLEKDGTAVWKAVTYRRPATDEEVRKFFEDPPRSFLAFYEEKIIGVTELPEPLRSLAPECLSRIQFSIYYLRGGIKLYPFDGTTYEEATALAKRVAGIWKK